MAERSIRCIPASPVDYLFDNMTFVEQFAESVLDYSSKYNSMMSISYAPDHITGKPDRYPNYGDFPDTYTLRTYGKWWNESESAQAHYMPQDEEEIVSEDFIIVGFEIPVIPCSIVIYETFNPGAVVRLWGRMYNASWVLLHEAAAETPTSASARKFMPPLKKTYEVINELRVELNQSNLKYHTALDAILLVGYKPHSALQLELFRRGIVGSPAKKKLEAVVKVQEETEGLDFFSQLPYEVLVHIFSYLDLRSLSRCSRINKNWCQAAQDPSLYYQISLKKYWHKVNSRTLQHLMGRCTRLRKLDVSWCADDPECNAEEKFIEFLQECGAQLTHLSCRFCKFIKSRAIKQMSSHRQLTDLRLRACYPEAHVFSSLSELHKLVTLDLYCTNVKDEPLIAILKANPNLKHLIIDFCEKITHLEHIAEIVAAYNKKIVTWSSWKTASMTSLGVMHLARCSTLRELDLGWCLVLSHPDHCLEKIALGCPNLKRLILCGWRGVSDSLLMQIVKNCKGLEQLDLMGIKNITGEVCEIALGNLPNMKLLDVSFCESIENEKITNWRNRFPKVQIQRSCEYVNDDYFY